MMFLLASLMLAACQPGEQQKSPIEKELEQIGLQNVAEAIPGIEVYMVYATPYNFMEECCIPVSTKPTWCPKPWRN